jgi:purine-binding chemotaxis protein CheW
MTQDAQRQLCTFQLGPYRCALDVAFVREVIRPRMPTPVPRAPTGVVGLVSLRGQILTAFDLGPSLGLDPRTDAPYGVVLEVENETVCLLTDEVGEVGIAAAGCVEPAPANLSAELRMVVEGAYRGPRNLFLVLSPRAVFDVTCLSAAACD